MEYRSWENEALPALQDFHQPWQQGTLRILRRHLFVTRSFTPLVLPCDPPDLCHTIVHVSVSNPGTDARPQPREDFREVTGLRPDVQNRRTHRQHVVNLAWVNESDERIAHHHHVQVRG